MNIDKQELLKKVREMKELPSKDLHAILEAVLFAYIDSRTGAKQALTMGEFVAIYRQTLNETVGRLIGALSSPDSLEQALNEFLKAVKKEKHLAAEGVIQQLGCE